MGLLLIKEKFTKNTETINAEYRALRLLSSLDSWLLLCKPFFLARVDFAFSYRPNLNDPKNPTPINGVKLPIFLDLFYLYTRQGSLNF